MPLQDKTNDDKINDNPIAMNAPAKTVKRRRLNVEPRVTRSRIKDSI